MERQHAALSKTVGRMCASTRGWRWSPTAARTPPIARKTSARGASTRTSRACSSCRSGGAAARRVAERAPRRQLRADQGGGPRRRRAVGASLVGATTSGSAPCSRPRTSRWPSGSSTSTGDCRHLPAHARDAAGRLQEQAAYAGSTASAIAGPAQLARILNVLRAYRYNGLFSCNPPHYAAWRCPMRIDGCGMARALGMRCDKWTHESTLAVQRAWRPGANARCARDRAGFRPRFGRVVPARRPHARSASSSLVEMTVNAALGTVNPSWGCPSARPADRCDRQPQHGVAQRRARASTRRSSALTRSA